MYNQLPAPLPAPAPMSIEASTQEVSAPATGCAKVWNAFDQAHRDAAAKVGDSNYGTAQYIAGIFSSTAGAAGGVYAAKACGASPVATLFSGVGGALGCFLFGTAVVAPVVINTCCPCPTSPSAS